MSRKLTGNGLWESSRMMLPEHKIALQEQKREQKKRERVVLDDQELQLIQEKIHQSMTHRQPIIISLFDPFEDLKVIGLIERVDLLDGRVRVNGDWFSVADIEGIKFEGE